MSLDSKDATNISGNLNFEIILSWSPHVFTQNETYDLSVVQLKPKPKTKNQIFFAGVNENLTTFLYTLNRMAKKTEGYKKFLFKVEMLLTKRYGF